MQERYKSISCTAGVPAGESCRLVLCLSRHLCSQMIPVTKHIQQIIGNERWVVCSVLVLFCPPCLNGTDVLETAFWGKEQNGERCQGCSVCQWSILWLDHINTNVAPQLALFDRLVHITRHLHNSASWDYVEPLPPAWMCWFPFHNCQLLPKVRLKDICFVVSVCYIKQKPSWDAALSCNRTSIFHICFVFSIYYIYILYILPPTFACCQR